jgi:SAM-dependent methyltransferase
MAAPFMAATHVIDIERDLDRDLGGPFDLLVFSHVLEHTRNPVDVLRRFLPMLNPRGHVLIAVPNTLEWRTRMCFLRGDFLYADSGILDRTHLRFFTYQTAAKELVEPLPELTLLVRKARGSLPFGRLRRRLLPDHLLKSMDNTAVRCFPNLFAGEVALLAKRTAS